jgi:ribosomal protein S18 acetylase RimI-like enzyme
MEVRCFRQGDEPAVVELWNGRVRGCFAAGPLDEETFARDVAGKRYFDPEGLFLAFQGGRPAAFAHAGFKSSDWVEPNLSLGTVSMVAVEEDQDAAGEAGVAQAVRYLARRGARQVEAFTIDFPNTPFYNGLYGGEKAGMDEAHPDGLELMRRCRFNVTTGAVIMTCELDAPGPSSPAPERLTLEVGPWDSPLKGRKASECYGIPEVVRRARLLDEAGAEKGGITFWHLDRHNRAAGDHRAVVSHVWVSDGLRGSGAAPWLQGQVHRILQDEGARRVSLGAGGANGRAVRFYQKLGYRPVGPAYTFHLDWRAYEN